MQCDAAVPVKEHPQALLRLAWCKGGHNTASGLPLALVNQRQIFITPEDTATPGWFISTQLHAEGINACVLTVSAALTDSGSRESRLLQR